MYRPPENTNRVKLIKSKFENLESAPETVIIKKPSNGKLPTQNLERQLSDPSKRNIKRTPAFRIDDKNKNFSHNSVQYQSFYNEKVQQFSSALKNQNSNEENVQKNLTVINPTHLYSVPCKIKNTASETTQIGLTDSLKAALKRPLPQGPAPQKPPRTFEHLSNASTVLEDIGKNTLTNSNKLGPSNKKHDARYMLSKLETALRASKIKNLKKTCLNETTTSEDSDEYYGGKTAGSNHRLVNTNNGKNKSTFFVSSVVEPVYAQPLKLDNQKNFKTNKDNKKLYYMSTSLLSVEKSEAIKTMDSQKHAKKQSSHATIKELINSFENNSPNKPDSVSTSDLKNGLQNCDIKESSDEFDSSDSRISVDKMINKFQTYVKTMPKYKVPKINADDHLFYCCLIVGWENQKSKIKLKYPNVTTPEKIEDLCYPEAISGPLDVSNSAQCYTLVITGNKGDRTFGYCRRVIPEGSTNCIPLTYCILSRHRAVRFYRKVLMELESRHGVPDKARDELIMSFYNNKFPLPGESVKIKLPKSINDIYYFIENDYNHYGQLPDLIYDKALTVNELTLTLHHDSRYEETDLKLLHTLPKKILLKVFASLLLERKVIFISCMISKLSSCVDALQSILYPFSWPHTFIPILPQCLWEIVESPTPVICGVLSINVVNNFQIEHGIVIDLDENNIISQQGDEDRILSDSMKKAWYDSLALANTVPPDDYTHSVHLSDAYIKVFIVSIKHYKNYIINNTFQRNEFIRNVKSKGVRRFLEWFTDTTMFLSFIDSVIANEDSYSLFNKKIEMYGSEGSNLILSKLREWKKS